MGMMRGAVASDSNFTIIIIFLLHDAGPEIDKLSSICSLPNFGYLVEPVSRVVVNHGPDLREYLNLFDDSFSFYCIHLALLRSRWDSLDGSEE
jgi:hypothetical protein